MFALDFREGCENIVKGVAPIVRWKDRYEMGIPHSRLELGNLQRLEAIQYQTSDTGYGRIKKFSEFCPCVGGWGQWDLH